MLDDESLKQRKISLRQTNIPSQQSMNRIWTQRECRHTLVQLTHRDGSVVADFGNLLDEFSVAARNPANAEAREGVGFAEGAGGDGICVAS
jgi:hypothetical protein